MPYVARRFCRRRNSPAPAKPIIAIHPDGGRGVGLGAVGLTVIENAFEALAVAVPLRAMMRRRPAAWLDGPAGGAVVETGVSLTEAVKLKVPEAVGVPVMAPVLVLRFNPVGREPVTRVYR